MVKGSERSLRQINANRMLSILLAGVVAGLVTLISSVSFAALIFHGKLTPYLSSGITILISTAVVAGSLFSIMSSARPVIALPDDDTAPVLALMVTMILASFPADTPVEVLFITTFGALACAALLTGIVLTALGYFKLGSLVRYLPYSVMGGYFAGAGWLMIQGALSSWQRNPARKVWVLQCPKGALMRSRWPRRERPRRRVILVLT